MIDGQSMEVEATVLAPEQAVSSPSAALLSKKALPSDATSTAKRRAARRKTLCDITNLSKREPADDVPVPDESSACPAAPAPASAGGGFAEVAQLLKKNEELVRLLAEKQAENQKLRLANWEIARANTQMMAEINRGGNTLKALQHALTCSRASLKSKTSELKAKTSELKAKTSELEDLKKTMPRRNAPVQRAQHPGPDRAGQTKDGDVLAAPVQRTQHPGPDRAVQTKDGDVLAAPVQRTQHHGPDRAAQNKDGDVLDAEPASDASRARSIQMSGNASRKRVLRSRSLGPTTPAKLALPKDKDRDASQRRKSMRTPQTSRRTEVLFEIEDVQLAISSCKIDPESASGSDKPGHQFLRRSSLGRPLRQARERVTTYKEMPLHVKLRRP